METTYRKGTQLSDGGNSFFKISSDETIIISNYSKSPSIEVIGQSLEFPMEVTYSNSSKSEFLNEYLKVLDILKMKVND